MTVVAATRRVNRGRGHSYLLDGAPVDGVTTVIKNGVPAPALVNWAARVTADKAVNEWDELAELPLSERLRKLQYAPNDVRNKGGVRGTAVHELAVRLAAGQDVEVPEPLLGHVDAYLAFARDWEPDELLVEVPVFARASLETGRPRAYGGTLDLVARLADGRTWLLDWKTAASGVFPENALQLAAYRYADFWLDDQLAEQPLPRIDCAGVVWVRADGYDLVPVEADADAFDAFVHAQEIAAFRDQERERWIGEALAPPIGEEAVA